ncbi:MAG TPA: DUF4012 domain-containing protein [Marmoricola sp.]|jgi:hypothetical protein|nr:DUF4012 domain-containing protein [Marmoricola sp.]
MPSGLSRRRVVGILLFLLLVALATFTWQAVVASRALLDARSSGELVQKRIHEGDFDGAGRALGDLRTHTHKAKDSTDGFLWDIGRHVPFVGRNIGAVQTVSDVLDTATRQNAPIALELSKAVDEGKFRPKDQRIDLAEVERLAPAVRRAADSIDRAADDLAGTRAEDLLFPFNDLVGDLQDQIDRARSAATASAHAFELLPDMLGEEQPRKYLLMIQNPAELRSTGGLPGSLAILNADNGKVSMGWQGSATDVNGFAGPVVKLAKDTEQQYGPSPAYDFRDANFTPDFPEAAQIVKAMVEAKRHVKLDGVISVDPIAVAALMRGTGPVTVTNGVTLNAGNVVAALLNQTYQVLDTQAAQDSFFESAARKIFDSVMSGKGDQQQAIRGLAAAGGQHRVLVWSAHDDEENMISDTAVAGSLVGRSDRPQVGMYINDSTAGKMDYYLQYRSTAAAVDCRQGGAQDIRATLALTSTMPTDFRALSVWILGNGQYAAQGQIAFNLRVYAPYGGEITGLSVDGVQHSVTADKHHGRQVALLPITLNPGQKMTVAADIRTARGQSGDGVFSFTPGMVPAPNGVSIASACH